MLVAIALNSFGARVTVSIRDHHFGSLIFSSPKSNLPDGPDRLAETPSVPFRSPADSCQTNSRSLPFGAKRIVNSPSSLVTAK